MQKNAGFSLVEILIAVGMLGLVASMVMKMNRGINNQKVQNEFMHSGKSFGLELSRAMSVPANCAATLTNANLTSTDLTSSPTVTAILDPNLNPIYAAGATYDHGTVRLEGMQITDYVPPATADNIAGFSLRFRIRYLKETEADPVLTTVYRGTVQVDPTTNEPVVPVNCFAGITDEYVKLGGDTMTGPLIINRTAAVPPKLGLRVNNGYIQTNVFFLDSDRRLKDRIAPIHEPLALLDKVRGRNFVWKNSGLRDWGFIAQEVEENFPNLVTPRGETGNQALKYLSFVPLQIEALKEVKAQLTEMKLKTDSLRARILRLQKKAEVE